MRISKKISVLLLALAAAASLCACSGGDKTEYKDDVSTDDIASQVIAIRNDWSFAEMEDSYIAGAMKLDTSIFADYTVEMNAQGTNVDEFGIFKAEDSDSVEEVKKAAENYLQFRLNTWMEEYMPEEKPKLENAEVKTCGLYVMYAIFDDDTRSKAFNAFESYLKK